MKSTPQPNVPRGHVSNWLGETWLESEREGPRRARVRFPDGKLRVVRCSGVSDTWFSVSCHSHDGFITGKETVLAPDGEFVFYPHNKSADLYGRWESANPGGAGPPYRGVCP